MIHTSHRRGSFCAAILRTHAVDRAATFYGALLGYTTVAVPGTDDAFRWLLFEGRKIGAILAVAGTDEWLPYVSVDDVDATIETAASLGASLSDRTDVAGVARLATIRDAEGARVGLWQPAPAEGIELSEVPGSLWWVEVLSDDPPRAKQFYRALFGWGTRETAFEPFDAYTVFERDGVQEGGVLPIGPDWEISPVWNAIYEVDNCDGVMQRACDLGGAGGFVHTVPKHGRIGSIIDPNGALLCLRGPVPAAV